MLITCIVLEVIGWVLPIGSAGLAYRRLFRSHPADLIEKDGMTYGGFEKMMSIGIPDLLRSQRDALKWPALIAGVGVTSSTVSGILSMLFL